MDDSQVLKVIDGPLLVDWPTQGDEWISWFERVIAEQNPGLRVTGMTSDERTRPCFEIRTGPYPMLVGVADDGSYILVRAGDHDEHVPESVTEAWVNAARAATQSLGALGPAHEWSAIIGPKIPRVYYSPQSESLVGRISIGDMQFVSTEKMLIERASSAQHPSFAGWSLSITVPILVTGSTNGYSWQSAAVNAARDLNVACALISVIWGTPIVVRESPAPLSMGLRTAPDRSPDLPIEYIPEFSNGPEEKDVPAWVSDAWKRLAKRPRLVNALAAYHEGLKIEATNPSLGLVAFVAAVDAISQMVFHKDRCENCHSHRYLKDKFTETLRIVVSDEQALLLGSIYGDRSRTVHDGRLFGFEMHTGASNMGLWTRGEADQFIWGKVMPLREAVQKLLLLALKGELPARRRFDGSSSK